MDEIKDFKRMNFFTGFFTTAADWQAEQGYHWWKMTYHNRGLHTPGIMRQVGNEFKVDPAGDRNVLVQPGVALDGDGREILLAEPRHLSLPVYSEATTVYIYLTMSEELSDMVTNVQNPSYSNYTRVSEKVKIDVGIIEPDNRNVLELARIDLLPGASPISAAADPNNPEKNEIDRLHIKHAGAVNAQEAGHWLEPDLQKRLVDLMALTRKDFVDLGNRFPTPSVGDVRHAALTVEMLARIGFMRAEHLSGLISSLADLERDAGQEIGVVYPGLVKMQEYGDYVAAVDKLRSDIVKDTGTFLNSQEEVAISAKELSEVVLSPPDAYTGGNQNVTAVGAEAEVALDASASKAYGGRTIARYLWDMKESVGIPQSSAGADQEVNATAKDESVVKLDASSSAAGAGQVISRYIWRKIKSIDIPASAAGGDRTVTADDSGEATVLLDGSGSSAADGEKIAKYRWNKS